MTRAKRWQDVPEIAALREQLFKLTGSYSHTASLLAGGYWKNKTNPDGTEEPGEYVPPSEHRRQVEAIKAHIRRLREEYINDGLRRHIDARNS